MILNKVMSEKTGNNRKKPKTDNLGGLRSAQAPQSAPQNGSFHRGTTRSLKACLLCRKQKTRCFRSSSIAVSCLRCLGLNRECSLETEFKAAHPNVRLIDGIPEDLYTEAPPVIGGVPNEQAVNMALGDTKRKLDLIYSGVSELLLLMKGEDNEPRGPILERDVKLLLDAASTMKKTSLPSTPNLFLDTHGSTPGGSRSLQGHIPNLMAGQRSGHHDDSLIDTEAMLFLSPPTSFKTSPYCAISGLVQNIPRPISKLLNLSTVNQNGRKAFFDVDLDIITSGVLTELEVIDLMTDFRSNYGRWVLFLPHTSTEELVKQIRTKSSLLLTTCCCLSMRYSLNLKLSPGDIDNHRRKKDTYKLVMRQLVKDLDKSLLKYASFQGSSNFSGDIEFLQAIVILSIYSLSLSSIVTNTVDPDSLVDEDLNLRDLNLDSWYLSGLGLSTFISKANFGTLFHSINSENDLSPNFTVLFHRLDSNEDQKLTVLRIYNHLILIHLVSCVFSGRMCIVDEIRLNYCMSSLSLPSATNFDGRMVSEIGILLITYNFIQVNQASNNSKDLSHIEANLLNVREEITAWYEQWDYLFTQPALQFVEFCYHFCYILIYINYIYSKLLVASKISMGTDFFHPDIIEDILQYADKASIVQIVSHAYVLVKFILTVEDDSYFAYLSDQIHFCFFFGALTLMRSLRFLRTNDKLHYLSSAEARSNGLSEQSWKKSLNGVFLLIEKYERVAQDNPDDIITKYKSGLMECLHVLFPGVTFEGMKQEIDPN